MLDTAELPDDIAALKAMLVAAALRDQRKDERIKLNIVYPHARLTVTLRAIVTEHKQNRINDLLPWNYDSDV